MFQSITLCYEILYRRDRPHSCSACFRPAHRGLTHTWYLYRTFGSEPRLCRHGTRLGVAALVGSVHVVSDEAAHKELAKQAANGPHVDRPIRFDALPVHAEPRRRAVDSRRADSRLSWRASLSGLFAVGGRTLRCRSRNGSARSPVVQLGAEPWTATPPQAPRRPSSPCTAASSGRPEAAGAERSGSTVVSGGRRVLCGGAPAGTTPPESIGSDKCLSRAFEIIPSRERSHHKIETREEMLHTILKNTPNVPTHLKHN